MDMMELLGELKARLPGIEFCYYEPHRPADVLLVLNACQVECAAVPAFSGPVLHISPNSIDHWITPPELLCRELCARLSALDGAI